MLNSIRTAHAAHRSLLTRQLRLLAAGLLMACLAPWTAGATSSSNDSGDGGGTAYPSIPVGSAAAFSGSPLSVLLDIDAASDPGSLVITLTVDDGYIGDLRGVFFHVSDASLLDGLAVTGEGVTSSEFDEDNVINLGQGANLNAGDSPCPCDFGVQIGTPGIGRDDYQSVTFTLSHETEMLDPSLLNGELFGVRVTSVSEIGGDREGSSKLVGVVPEPTTALLMLLGLGGLSVAGSRRPRTA